jgi:hypothetical protein
MALMCGVDTLKQHVARRSNRVSGETVMDTESIQSTSTRALSATASVILRVTIKKVETLFLAQSPDLPGLLVQAREPAAALAKVPDAIEAILSYEGPKFIVVPTNSGTAGYHVFVAVPVEMAEKALRRVEAA